MKTINEKKFAPRRDCWAFKKGMCSICTELICERKKCSHYQTAKEQRLKAQKSQDKLENLGLKVIKEKNRVSGN